MAFAEYGPWGCWACVACDRVWMPGESVHNVFRLTKGAPSVGDVIWKAAANPSAENLQCPTCRRPTFGTFATTAATIEACTGCAGIHFGPGQYQGAFPGAKRVLDGGLSGRASVAIEAAAVVLIALLS